MDASAGAILPGKEVATMTIIYDVLLQRRHYKPVTGYYGEPEYICIFYDEDRKRALKEMQKYVKKNGFVTPDRQFTVEDVVLREREATGEVISITPYHKLFDTITDELLKKPPHRSEKI